LFSITTSPLVVSTTTVVSYGKFYTVVLSVGYSGTVTSSLFKQYNPKPAPHEPKPHKLPAVAVDII